MGVASKGEQDAATVNRINILFVMIEATIGGTERLVLDLVKNLDRRLFAPSVAWFIEERPMKDFEDLQIPLYYLSKQKRFDWSTMRKLGRIVRTHRIDVINAHHFMPVLYAAYAAKLANHAKLVYTEHSESDVLSATGKWKILGACLLRSCDAVVGISDRVSKTLTTHFRLNPHRVHTIKNGVDVAVFEQSAKQRPHMRAQFGFKPQDLLIGHVANFRRNKNHLFLLRAFREVVLQRPDAKLIFVGMGFPGDPENSEDEIKEYIRRHGLQNAVHLVGHQPNVQDFLAMMDVFCLVSYKEGLPLSLIEAMASGLPVVGTDIEGIRGVIEPEVNGLVVQPDDVPGLSLALTRLIDDAELRRRMGAAGRATARQRYTLTRCIEETQRLFLSTLGPGGLDGAKAPVAARSL